MLMLIRPLQPLKALLPMLVTELGKVMLNSPVHPWNAESQILMTPLQIVTFLMLELPLNQSPIFLQLKDTVERELQPENAL